MASSLTAEVAECGHPSWCARRDLLRASGTINKRLKREDSEKEEKEENGETQRSAAEHLCPVSILTSSFGDADLNNLHDWKFESERVITHASATTHDKALTAESILETPL